MIQRLFTHGEVVKLTSVGQFPIAYQFDRDVFVERLYISFAPALDATFINITSNLTFIVYKDRGYGRSNQLLLNGQFTTEPSNILHIGQVGQSVDLPFYEQGFFMVAIFAPTGTNNPLQLGFSVLAYKEGN